MARLVLNARTGTLPVNPAVVRSWLPSVGIWGIGAAFAVSYLMSDVPLFKKDVLDKIPVVRRYFIDDVPPSDKPF